MEYQSVLKIVFGVLLIIAYIFIAYNVYEAYDELDEKQNVVEQQKVKTLVVDIEEPIIDLTQKNDTNQTIKPIKDYPIFNLTEYERWVVECMVMGESGGESYEGQMLVAQCILNACLKDDITPSEVRKKYKYSGWNESLTDSVKNAVSAVFDLGEKVTSESILYFYAPSLIQSEWHETQEFVIECGGHRFFKEK